MQFEVSEVHAMEGDQEQQRKAQPQSPSEGQHGGATITLERCKFISASLTLAVPNLVSHQTRTCIHGGKLCPLQC